MKWSDGMSFPFLQVGLHCDISELVPLLNTTRGYKKQQLEVLPFRVKGVQFEQPEKKKRT